MHRSAARSCVEIIDPANRTGKIVVPFALITETRGLVDHFEHPERRDVKDLSLCLLFQRGRCNAGMWCHQVHADVAFVQRLREEAATLRNCCAAHGDVHSREYSQFEGEVHMLTATGALAAVYGAASFARTATMDTLMHRALASGHALSVSSTKLCRLHAQRRCKFGRDCKHIHLCPEAQPLWRADPASPPPSPPPPSPPPLRVSIVGPPPLGIATRSCSEAPSCLRESCGVSNCSFSSRRSSAASISPLERPLAPLSVGEVPSVTPQDDDGGFDPFARPLRPVQVQVPSFDPAGFELELSLVQQDLLSSLSVALTTPHASPLKS